MIIFLKMGFKNLFRNKRRTFLTSIVMGLGLSSMIITDGFMEGMSENMIHTVTNSLVSEGQIHHFKFEENFDVNHTILNFSKVNHILNKNSEVQNFSKRILSFAMISSPRNMKNIRLYGVQKNDEIQVSNTHKYIIKGNFLDQPHGIVIGEKLRKHLGVELGEKLILTALRAKNKIEKNSNEINNDEMGQILLRLTGVIQTGSVEMDESIAFITLKKAQEFLNLNNRYHEVALKFNNRKKGEKVSNQLWPKIEKETQNKAQSWVEIMSSFVKMLGLFDQSKAITFIVLMILVGFAVVNTLFMAIYERSFEFAVLRALGTKKSEIVFLILSEAFFMVLISFIMALILTLVFAAPLSIWGVDYGGMEFAKVTFKEPVYYVFQIKPYLIYPLGLMVFTLIISVYPALFAAFVTMERALKRTL